MYRFLIISFFLSSCANMNEVVIYDSKVENNEGINGFTSIDIFSHGGSDEVWGNSDEECNPLSFSSRDASIDYSLFDKSSIVKLDTSKVDVKYDLPLVQVKDKKGIEKNSLHIKTNKSPTCEWVGMGIGWDSWQGKDLSTIINEAAIEFMARVDGDPIYNIPIVFILEDYSANQCYATAGYLGIEGGKITNKWTRVIIPLPTFSYQTHNIDLTNIKQLLLQCYDKVDIYIDEMKIIPYNHNYKKNTASLTVSTEKFPIDIFSEDLPSASGISEFCHNIQLNTDVNYLGGKFIDVNIKKKNCNWSELAISWNNWLYTDLSNSIYGVYLDFDIKLNNYQKTIISIQDYDGRKMNLDLSKYIRDIDSKDWQKVRIPIKKFPIRKSEIDLERIKDINFSFIDKTKLRIDNIKLTK